MNLKEIDFKDLYRKWKSNLGIFQGFVRSTPFVSLQTYDDFDLDSIIKIYRDKNTIENIIKKCSENSFVIVDLPLNEIIDLGLILNNEYSIKPILNVNLLFHPYGIIGKKDNINKLINNGLSLKNINTNKFVMLIPYDRYRDEKENILLKNKLNNQYGIGEDDLPEALILKEAGYSSITIITKDKIKDDLNDYVNFIKKDINVEIIR